MNDQDDVASINQQLYKLEIPKEPIQTIMFYFTILHNVIDYPFPPNFLNFNTPFFKTYKDVKKFISLSQALSPEFLRLNNVIIYHNNKNFYKGDDNNHDYQFRIIDPKYSNSSDFKSNYANSYNIKNIDFNQKQFECAIKNDIQYPHSEDSDYSSTENYYYEEGLEDDYQKTNNPYICSNENLNEHYNSIRKNYNENIIKNSKQLKNYLYENQMIDDTSNIEEEEDMNEINENSETIEKINIINKLVCSTDFINQVYTIPMKKAVYNVKSIIQTEDIVRMKSVSMPKSIFFYLLIFLVLLILACASVLIYSCVTLDANPKFLALNGEENETYDYGTIDYRNDTVIIPCHSCFKKVLKGNHMGMVSAIFSINFIIFVFIIYLYVVSGQARRCKKKYGRTKKNKKMKINKMRKKTANGFNMIYFICFIFLILIAIIFCLTAEVLFIIGLSVHSYFFIHRQSVIQLIMNSIILVSYFLFFIFYFKQ